MGGNTARVRRNLPLQLLLQIPLRIFLSLLLTGHLPYDARRHLPKGPMCPWRKTPAAARTKLLSPFSCETPTSSLNLPPFPGEAPFGCPGLWRGPWHWALSQVRLPLTSQGSVNNPMAQGLASSTHRSLSTTPLPQALAAAAAHLPLRGNRAVLLGSGWLFFILVPLPHHSLYEVRARLP